MLGFKYLRHSPEVDPNLEAQKQKTRLAIEEDILRGQVNVAKLSADFLELTGKSQREQHALLQQIRDDSTRERAALAEERLIHAQKIQGMQERIDDLQRRAAQMERDTADKCSEMLTNTKRQIAVLNTQVEALEVRKARLASEVHEAHTSAVEFANLKTRAIEGMELALRNGMPPIRHETGLEFLHKMFGTVATLSAVSTYLQQLYDIELVFGKDARKDVANACALKVDTLFTSGHEWNHHERFFFSSLIDDEGFHRLYKGMTQYQQKEITRGNLARLSLSIVLPHSNETLIGGDSCLEKVDIEEFRKIQAAIDGGSLHLSDADEMVDLCIYQPGRLAARRSEYSPIEMIEGARINLDRLLERGVTNLEPLSEIKFSSLHLHRSLNDDATVKSVVRLLVALQGKDRLASPLFAFWTTHYNHSVLGREEYNTPSYRRNVLPTL